MNNKKYILQDIRKFENIKNNIFNTYVHEKYVYHFGNYKIYRIMINNLAQLNIGSFFQKMLV